MNFRKFWIRRDRETYFISGVIIACSIASFVSSYWHFTDRISVRQKINIRTRITDKTGNRKLRDLQFTPVKRSTGTGGYYKMDESFIPAVPMPDDDE